MITTPPIVYPLELQYHHSSDGDSCVKLSTVHKTTYYIRREITKLHNTWTHVESVFRRVRACAWVNV